MRRCVARRPDGRRSGRRLAARPARALAAVPLLGALALFAPPQELDAQPPLLTVEVRGPLDRGAQSHLRRALELAEAQGADLVLELDTPGGEVELMWQMARMLLEADEKGVRTIAWVNDEAISAGSLLAMACELLYLRPTATIGSALPVRIGVDGLMPVSEDDAVREKLLSKFRAEFRAIAAERGRPPVLAEAMVDPSVAVVEVVIDGERRLLSDREYQDVRDRGEQPRFLRTILSEGELLNLSGREALELGLADGLVDSEQELAAKLGRAPRALEPVRRTRSEDLARLLYTWSPILLVLGLVFGYLELKIPGFGIPGILAILCFGLLLAGRWLIGLADVPHIVLIVLGIALVALELFVLPGTIWFAVLGAACLLGGVVWSFAGAVTGFEYPLDREILLDEAGRVLLAAGIALLATWALSRFLPHTPIFGRLVLQSSEPGPATAAAMPEVAGRHRSLARVGARGRSLTPLRPVGKVVLEGEESVDFEALAVGGSLEAGSEVVVVEVSAAGRLLVEPARAPELSGPPQPKSPASPPDPA